MTCKSKDFQIFATIIHDHLKNVNGEAWRSFYNLLSSILVQIIFFPEQTVTSGVFLPIPMLHSDSGTDLNKQLGLAVMGHQAGDHLEVRLSQSFLRAHLPKHSEGNKVLIFCYPHLCLVFIPIGRTLLPIAVRRALGHLRHLHRVRYKCYPSYVQECRVRKTNLKSLLSKSMP